MTRPDPAPALNLLAFSLARFRRRLDQERAAAWAARYNAAAIASGSWLPLDLEGSEVRRRPVPCQHERIRRRLDAGQRSMRITDAAGAVVYETTTQGITA